MISTLIPDFDTEVSKLHELAPSGFVLAFNYRISGPEYMYSGYPEEWKAIYEDRNLALGDPVLVWSFTRSGTRRWSEIPLPDVRNVMDAAAEFDIKYGAIVSVKKGLARSICSVARGDREFTDDEISSLEEKFQLWCDLVTNRASLTDKEIAVLRRLRDGMSQRDMAVDLQIAEATVKQRALSASRKLNAKTRTQAVAISIQRGFLDDSVN